NIGVVFGQKSQLNWDLPLIESFELLKYIYKIPQQKYDKNLQKFTELLDMQGFLNQPVRQLSLGQRMRGDIVAALLHSPKIVFFDEPTIGLDVVAKEKIREFVKYMNEMENTTMIFTTHDMQDIEKVCTRLIIIDEGRKIYDGSVEQIKNQYAALKSIEILLEDGKKEKYTFDVNKTPMNEVMERLFSKFDIKDISICEPEIDGIIRDIYEGGIRVS
ncbi:MAG: ATP-binding cassette domain-containing protein, partial [Lachnospiraceae bacterium]|nr:ATP-binding cassette domain-containing protein [Lachnospiraceae bacterium]